MLKGIILNVGGVSERPMEAVLKTVVSGHRDRGFESHPLRFNLSVSFQL